MLDLAGPCIGFQNVQDIHYFLKWKFFRKGDAFKCDQSIREPFYLVSGQTIFSMFLVQERVHFKELRSQ
jgi:hypothetical protein